MAVKVGVGAGTSVGVGARGSGVGVAGPVCTFGSPAPGCVCGSAVKVGVGLGAKLPQANVGPAQMSDSVSKIGDHQAVDRLVVDCLVTCILLKILRLLTSIVSANYNAFSSK